MRMTSIVQLLLLATLNAAFANDFPFSAILASDPATQKPIYTVDWSYNRMNKTITFRLTVNSTGWLGFGLSPTGGMKDSDIVVGWVTKNGEAIIYVSVKPALLRHRWLRCLHGYVLHVFSIACAEPGILYRTVLPMVNTFLP